jgi:hypothetical protein
MLSSGQFVTWEYDDILFRVFRHVRFDDVHFWSFRHVKFLWCSLLVISPSKIAMVSLTVISSREIFMMFNSFHFVTWDYNFQFRLFRSVRSSWFNAHHFNDCPDLTSPNLYTVQFTERYSSPAVRFTVLVRCNCVMCKCVTVSSSGYVVKWRVIHSLI